MVKRLFFCFILSLNPLIFPLVANENPIDANDENLVKDFVKDLNLHRSVSPLHSPYQYCDENLNIVPIESFTTEPINFMEEDLASSLTLKEKDEEKFCTFEELVEKFMDFKKELFLQTKELAVNNYNFEEKMFIRPLRGNKDTTLFNIYQFLNRMAGINSPDFYQVDTHEGKPFTIFNLRSSSNYAELFVENIALQYFCSTVYNEPLIFPRDQQKAKLLVNQGVTFDQIKEILKRIHSFLPNPGLYIKIRNTFNTKRNSKISESIYSTLEGAPGNRRNSITSSTSSLSPQLKSIVEKLSSTDVSTPDSPRTELSSKETPISSPVKVPFRRGSKGYPEGDTTAEFLKKYQRRNSLSFSSNSPLSTCSPSSLSQSPTSCSFQISTPSKELQFSNRSVIPPLSLESPTIMEEI